MGAAGPHSVMPFGSVLSIPAINTFIFRKFKGGTASVLARVPMLRYFKDSLMHGSAMAWHEEVCVFTLCMPIALCAER